MGRQRLTNTEKLLREIKRRGTMTRKDMVKYLLQLNGSGATSYLENKDRGTYSALIYGTSKREGITERFCAKTEDGFKVVRPIRAPFTPLRETF